MRVSAVFKGGGIVTASGRFLEPDRDVPEQHDDGRCDDECEKSEFIHGLSPFKARRARKCGVMAATSQPATPSPSDQGRKVVCKLPML